MGSKIEELARKYQESVASSFDTNFETAVDDFKAGAKAVLDEVEKMAIDVYHDPSKDKKPMLANVVSVDHIKSLFQSREAGEK